MASKVAEAKLTGARKAVVRKARSHNLAFWTSTAVALVVLGVNAIRF